MDKLSKPDASFELFKLGFEDEYWLAYWMAICRLREEKERGLDREAD